MDRLSRRDLRAVLDFVAQVNATADLDGFVTETTRGVARIMPADTTVYNEVNIGRRRINWFVEPDEGDRFPDSRQIFARHMREHPILQFRKREHDGKAIKVSDFLSRPDWRQTALYNEFYRRMRLEHSISISLSTPAPLMIEFTLLRETLDFTERERAILDLLRPHLATAYRNAELITDHRRQLALLYRGVDAFGCAAILLTRSGRIHSMTEKARAWVMEYFPGTESTRLPDALIAWSGQREWLNDDDDEPPPPQRPFSVVRPGKRLVVHLLREGNRRILLLQEIHERLRPEELRPLGLTRREAEILAWAAGGKTDAEVAAILGISPRTVSHTLERIYRKLGVETRVAAATLAVRYARRLIVNSSP